MKYVDFQVYILGTLAGYKLENNLDQASIMIYKNNYWKREGSQSSMFDSHVNLDSFVSRDTDEYEIYTQQKIITHIATEISTTYDNSQSLAKDVNL